MAPEAAAYMETVAVLLAGVEALAAPAPVWEVQQVVGAAPPVTTYRNSRKTCFPLEMISGNWGKALEELLEAHPASEAPRQKQVSATWRFAGARRILHK